MTGFGAATGRVGTQRVTVELRTVNHRFFNPHVKLPSSFSRWEADVRELLRRSIARGNATLTARAERDAAAPLAIDEDRFAGYVTQLRDLQQRHGLATEIGVDTVLRMPEVFSSSTQEEVPESPDELTSLVGEALDALTRMREAEGERLAAVLEGRVSLVAGTLDRIAERAPARLVEERERLSESVREIAGGVDVEPARLAQEIAFLADRLDVAEEIDRFRAHIEAFRAALHAPSREPVGKRLGFLLQEMLREANTTGSKARDAEMTHHVVAVKEELERIAEQVENVE
jgi:uncharacterized protein (TIGR00255 family)